MKKIVVYTDGSSRGNPGPGGWGSIIITPNNVFELGGNDEKTTINRMEMMAVLQTLQFLKDHEQYDQEVIINTDSSYLKNGLEKWVYGWQKNGWLTAKKDPVLNQDLWEILLELQQLFSNLKINHVRGHVGIPGNERADAIATGYADEDHVDLYVGPRDKYPLDLEMKSISAKEVKKKKVRRTGKAYCYLAFVSGVAREFSNWEQCKQFVEGKKGAKYRRADSEFEKKQIIQSWQK